MALFRINDRVVRADEWPWGGEVYPMAQTAAWDIVAGLEAEAAWDIVAGLETEAAWDIAAGLEAEAAWDIGPGLEVEAAWVIPIRSTVAAEAEWVIRLNLLDALSEFDVEWVLKYNLLSAPGSAGSGLVFGQYEYDREHTV